jgi:hypothetical protein
MLWTTPKYRFRLPVDDDPGQLREIVIDVTASAPPFKEPSDDLKEVLREIFKSFKLQTIVEFGAGKLKNIPFILDQGKTVCAVDFKELSQNAFTKKNLKKCEKYGARFQKLIFPEPFLHDPKKFDLALLLNVPPIMPVPAERLYLLEVLYKKLNEAKYLLWVAQKEGSYKAIREKGENTCGDGLWMGKTRSFKTFYRYHRVEELDEVMALYGFELIKRFDVGDDARIYRKTNHRIFSGLITPARIRAQIPIDNTIKDPISTEPKLVKRSSIVMPVIPDPKSLSVESLYVEKIKSIPPSISSAETYHRTLSYALGRIFRGSLRNMDIKVNIDGGVKIIDTVFTNCADDGFFHNLRSKVDCSYPIVEMKNISGDPTNSELDQLNGRLNTNRGHFGMLICRNVTHKDAVILRCKTFLPDNYVLVLADEEIFELLEYARKSDRDELNDFMDEKVKQLLF